VLRREGVRTYVVRTEHLDADLQGMFTWLCTAPPPPAPPANNEDYPRKNDTELSGTLGERVARMGRGQRPSGLA